MKDFLEDLGKRIGETAETMTSKAGDAIEIQRLKGQIRGLARGNAVDLMELGKTIYDRYKEGGEVGEHETALCDAIKDREQTIGGYEKKIARLKGAAECTSCGRMVAKDMSFCPYCGEKVAAEEAADGEIFDEADAPAAVEDAEDHFDEMKKKAADTAEKAAEKAEKAAKKVGEKMGKAAEKTGKMAEKAADKAGKAAEKAADKAGKVAEKAAEKLNDAAEKVSDKFSGK